MRRAVRVILTSTYQAPEKVNGKTDPFDQDRTSAWDPVMVALAGALMLSIPLRASFIPAWRATKVDPLIALRAE